MYPDKVKTLFINDRLIKASIISYKLGSMNNLEEVVLYVGKVPYIVEHHKWKGDLTYEYDYNERRLEINFIRNIAAIMVEEAGLGDILCTG